MKILLLQTAVFIALSYVAVWTPVTKPSWSLNEGIQLAATSGEKPSANLTAAFGWGGAVDTDLKLSEFINRDHTLAARFMIQYERSYEGPILASGGLNGFIVSVAGYGEGRTGAEKLMVSSGGKRRYYTVGSRLAPRRWHWLAIVREGFGLRLYLNGEAIRADDSGTEFPRATVVSNATLRLGRRAESDAQFYGFIDDVALFNSALSEKTLKSYYQASPRIKLTEVGLIAAYTFDREDDGTGNREVAERAVSFRGGASKVEVSAARESETDRFVLPSPSQKTEVRLPFEPGQTWKVIQGYGQPLSHNGGGVFSFDFERVDGPSEGQPVYASAAGRVVALSDYNDPEPGDDISKDNFNYLQLEIGEGEVATYLHMKNGSLINALKDYAPLLPQGALPSVSLPAGALVGRVGNTWLKEQPRNWHLHFALVPYVNSPVSIPVAFSDYEVYDVRRKTWRRVARGVPEQNQIVRRTR